MMLRTWPGSEEPSPHRRQARCPHLARYSPLPFTHQGAHWLPHAGDWLGTGWGSPTERDTVGDDLATATAWAHDRARRLFIGEFGTFHLAAPDDRAAWTAHVRTTAEALERPWCYWDFATDFGAYDARRLPLERTPTRRPARDVNSPSSRHRTPQPHLGRVAPSREHGIDWVR
jgi:hypothetical protein